MVSHKFRNILFRNLFKLLKNRHDIQSGFKNTFKLIQDRFKRREDIFFNNNVRNFIYVGLGSAFLFYFSFEGIANKIIKTANASEEPIENGSNNIGGGRGNRHFFNDNDDDSDDSDDDDIDEDDLGSSGKNVTLSFKFNFLADVVERTGQALVCVTSFDDGPEKSMKGRPLANGSGFIVSKDGLILTSAHIISPSARPTTISVKLFDGTIYEASVEDMSIIYDLATIRIKPDNKLKFIKLGSSHDLRSGEWVVALGAPLTLANTVTCGVVSKVFRYAPELGLRGSSLHYIQTDAVITFGSAGGPLINIDGEAIGVNNMRITSGISFAIPIDYAKSLFELDCSSSKPKQKKTGDTTPTRHIGVALVSLNSEIIRELLWAGELVTNDKINSGVLIWKVVRGSPAEKGGLRPGDIVTHINGLVVLNSHSFHQLLQKFGDRTVTMTVFRGSKRLRVFINPETEGT